MSDLAHKVVRGPKVIVPTEAAERQAIVAFAELQAKIGHPELGLLIGIHNELPFVRGSVGNRFTFFRYLKAMGHKKGIPDLFLPVARRGFFGLWIEVKRTKKWHVTPDQEWWQTKLKELGYGVFRAIGAQPGCECLLWYITGRPTVIVGRVGE